MTKQYSNYSENFKYTDSMDAPELESYLEYIAFRLRGIASAMRSKKCFANDYFRMGDKVAGQNLTIEVKELGRRSQLWRAERQKVRELLDHM